MKPSYFQTPRTMDEAVWHPWGATIEISSKPKTNIYDFVFWFLALVVICAVIYIVMVN